MTLTEFQREERRLSRAILNKGSNTFEFAIQRANLELEKARQLINLTYQLQHSRAAPIRAVLERKLIRYEKVRDRFQRLKENQVLPVDKPSTKTKL